MKQITDRAIVLSRTNYGERDRIITLLGQKSGKITVFAKGVRAQKSRLAGGIELLCITDITFVEGKSDLKTLTSTRLLSYYERLSSNMNYMQQAFGAIKAINTISEDGSGQEYFEILSTFFEALNDGSYDPNVVELWFNVRLLSLAGTLPRTDAQVPSGAKNLLFNFDHDAQRFMFHPEGQYSVNDVKLVNVLASSPKPVKLQAESGSEAQLNRLLQLLLKTNATEV